MIFHAKSSYFPDESARHEFEWVAVPNNITYNHTAIASKCRSSKLSPSPENFPWELLCAMELSASFSWQSAQRMIIFASFYPGTGKGKHADERQVGLLLCHLCNFPKTPTPNPLAMSSPKSFRYMEKLSLWLFLTHPPRSQYQKSQQWKCNERQRADDETPLNWWRPVFQYFICNFCPSFNQKKNFTFHLTEDIPKMLSTLCIINVINFFRNRNLIWSTNLALRSFINWSKTL